MSATDSRVVRNLALGELMVTSRLQLKTKLQKLPMDALLALLYVRGHGLGSCVRNSHSNITVVSAPPMTGLRDYDDKRT